MTVYAVQCKCGERFNVDESHAKGVISCWRCKRRLRIRRRANDVHRATAKNLSLVVRLRRLWTTVARVFRSSWPSRRLRGHRAAWLLSFASWLAVGVVVCLAMLLPAFGDRWSVATVLLYAGRWIWLLPFLPLAVLATLLHRHALAPIALGVLVVVTSIMGWQSGWRSFLPAPDGEPLRVVTLNSGGLTQIANRLPELLDTWRADVVAFQECREPLHSAIRTLERWHSHSEGPLCLMSRFPIIAAEPMPRGDLERSREDGTGAGGAGFVIRYVLQTSDGPLGLTNLHLETARKGLESLRAGRPDVGRLRDNMDVRAIESQRARAFVDAGLVPMIVVGDFNAPPDSRNIRDDWDHLTNAFERVGSGFGYTRYNGWIRLRIDHQFHSTGVRAVRARVAEDVGSDHRPLVVDYRILERTSDR